MKVIILAGGRGTRLPHSARDIPKALVPLGGKTILEHIMDRLITAGISDIRLSLGFRADQIIEFVKARGYPCDWVAESEPLGTGGGTKLASRGFKEPFMVLNGDTFSDFDYPAIVRAHAPGHGLIVSYWKEDNRDYGFLDIDGEHIRGFLEKPDKPQTGFVSAGCSILEPEHVQGVARDAFMLELDVYPRLAEAGRLKAIRHTGFFEDIGTEERLAKIREVIA